MKIVYIKFIATHDDWNRLDSGFYQTIANCAISNLLNLGRGEGGFYKKIHFCLFIQVAEYINCNVL